MTLKILVVSYIQADDLVEIRNEILTNPLSIRSLFCGPFLVTFGRSQSDNLHTDVVLKLPVHSRFVAELEKDFQMNEKGGKNKRIDGVVEQRGTSFFGKFM